jgi:hypothetical protein
VPDPDEAVVCEPGRCADCGGELAEAERVGVAARQVFDVPLPPPPHVTAYRVVSAVSLQGGHRRRAAGAGSRAGRLRSGAARTGRERAVRALPAGGLLAATLGVKVSTRFLAGIRRRAAGRLEDTLLPGSATCCAPRVCCTSMRRRAGPKAA